MNTDTLYNLIINLIAKGYRTVLGSSDVNIRSGSVYLILQREIEYGHNSYYLLHWDDPATSRDKYKWDHEMSIAKYES
jgi:hypothetical protein